MLVRRIARPMLAATFIYGGIDTLRNPQSRVPGATPIVAPPSPTTSSVCRPSSRSTTSSARGSGSPAAEPVVHHSSGGDRHFSLRSQGRVVLALTRARHC